MTTARPTGPASATNGAVEFEWALFAKDSGQREDYGIVRASDGQVQRESMDKMIRHYSPGVPVGVNAGAPDELPWVTFTAAAVNQEPYVAVAIRRWPTDVTTEVDATGRTIVSTLFFCLSEAAFAQKLGSFLALYDAVREITAAQLRAEPRGRPLVVEATRRERITLFPAARDTRVDTALAAAALLLDRPVTVTLAQAMGVRTRIMFLDQVAALLPAGTAGALSAATWTDVRTHHGIRLGFGQDLGGGEAARLDPNHPPALAVLARAAAEAGRARAGGRYAAALAELLSLNAPGGRSPDRLAGLVARLAADGTPCTFRQPDTLANLLAKIAARTLFDAVKAGTAGLGEVRRYLRANPAGADPEGLLLGLLVRATQVTDFALLARQWPLPAGEKSPAATLARDLAGAPHSAEDLTPLVTGPGAVAAAVARVLLEPAIGATSPGAEDLALDLAIGHRGSTDAAWAPLRARLASDPVLTVLAVLRCLDTRRVPDLGELIAWLDPQQNQPTTPVLRPFRKFFHTGGKHPLDDTDTAVLAQLGPDLGDRALRGLLQLAVRHVQVKEAAPAISSWLAAEQQGTLSSRRQADWQAVIGTVPDERERGKLLAAIGAGPAKKTVLGRILGKDDARPAGPAKLPARWLRDVADSPADDRGLAFLVQRRQPALAGGRSRTELAFLGDGAGRVAVTAVHAPAQPGGQTGRPLLYAWSADHADFLDGGGRVHELLGHARAAAKSGQQPDHFLLGGPVAPAGGDDATEELARLVDSYGFTIVAATAARLLEGPLTVVAPGGAPPTYAERLGFLAAVLALLPAGASSALAVATWASRPDLFQLSFSDRPAAGHGGDLTWPPDLTEAHGLAGTYANRLGWVRATRSSTAEIIRTLAGLTEPVDLRDLETQLAAVGANPLFAWPPSGKPKELAAAQSRIRRELTGQPMGVDELGQATATLLAEGTLTDLELADRLLVALAGTADAERLLVGLLRAGGSKEQLARVQPGAVKMIFDNPAGLMTAIRDELRRRPAAGHALLTQAEARGNLPDWLGWLASDGGLPPSLTPFAAALAGHPPTEAELRRTGEFGPDAQATLLRVAARNAAPAPQSAGPAGDTGWRDGGAGR